MNRRTLFCLILPAAAIAWASHCEAQAISIYFSPRGGCTAATCAAIDAAKTSIDAAARRGVRVRVTTDRAQETTADAAARLLKPAGVDLRTDAAEKLQHNKYAIIDSQAVITGSFNWSENAESKNAENLLILRDPTTAAAFAADFAKHWSHSRPFVSRTPAPNRPHRPRALYFPSLHPRPRERFLLWHA